MTDINIVDTVLTPLFEFSHLEAGARACGRNLICLSLSVRFVADHTDVLGCKLYFWPN